MFRCSDGYHGMPERDGDSCEPIDCSDNVDVTDPASYNRDTGECLVCINNAAGQYCELCKPGMYGDVVTARNCTGSSRKQEIFDLQRIIYSTPGICLHVCIFLDCKCDKDGSK